MANDLILITGASSDIGMALIRHLMAGANPPVVLAHSYTGGPRIEALQQEFGELIQPLQADFSKREDVSAMADDIAARYGVPTAIVHMPAMKVVHERFSKFPWKQFDDDIAVQLESAIVLLQRFLPKMAKLPRARVVFMLSFVTQSMPPKFMSYYTILKYAQLGLMRATAAEYASTNVRINGISPSTVDTQFLSGITEVAVQMAAAASPQGRNATPQDLLGAIEFLLSPAADFITGADIPVTAGGSC